MTTIIEILRLASAFLAERGVERPRRVAEELLSQIVQLKRLELYLQFDRPIEDSALPTFRASLKRAVKGEPLQYILGEVEFFGCRIKTDVRGLIPRPETELLVDFVVKRHCGNVLWDICTGTGAIGIALKKKLPHLSVAASDISPEALSLAQENGRSNDVAVEFLCGDLLAPFEGRKADMIVCNPPYVTAKEYLTLDSSVRDYEPKQALIGGERGTEFYERLAAESPRYLNEGGKLFLEIGASQGAAVKEIFNSAPWGLAELFKDWAGKDRFFVLELQSTSRVFFSEN